jgi:hypothetical protein
MENTQAVVSSSVMQPVGSPVKIPSIMTLFKWFIYFSSILVIYHLFNSDLRVSPASFRKLFFDSPAKADFALKNAATVVMTDPHIAIPIIMPKTNNRKFHLFLLWLSPTGAGPVSGRGRLSIVRANQAKPAAPSKRL